MAIGRARDPLSSVVPGKVMERRRAPGCRWRGTSWNVRVPLKNVNQVSSRRRMGLQDRDGGTQWRHDAIGPHF